MKKLIENIKENCKITIKGKEYKVLSKAYYITDINNLQYIKLVLEGYMILVISDTDNYVCFGKVIEPSYEIINDFTLKYDNKLYNKAVTDYQRIAKIEFGDENIVEGELEYTDYESDDGKKVLSLTNDHKSDTLLDVIELEDIVI